MNLYRKSRVISLLFMEYFLDVLVENKPRLLIALRNEEVLRQITV